ncbi:ankyrin repeat domain-containing protein SOWAHA-like [Triplophysa rosa]|uniref:Ankyrin repeat domain-containing protein SOWAHA-like n=1 Tax=Triplophysa rosa TaxID=992332 RepID=A0A9W7TFR8_TRIRA|nr:ankyrin repeat domain-containing protein SOWAHA-like [Triplophysa rosa]KAI7796124.1 putative ankyrin repeat domain-containing protein SOWAHA-like [Triplophysa rosa]
MLIFDTYKEMDLTQEAILNTLIEGNGKVKNVELLSKFKEHLNCGDPAERKQNRDLFKTFVNNIAIVKEFQETKYIVLKKAYHHLLDSYTDQNTPNEKEDEDGSHPEEHQGEQNAHPQYVEGRGSDLKRSPSNVSFIQAALENSKKVNFKPLRSLPFSVPLKSDPDNSHGVVCPAKKEVRTNKPYMLPLRMPPIDISHNKQTAPEHLDNEQKPHSSPQCKRKPTDGVVGTSGSPQLQRHFKTPKQEEPKDLHHFPLDSLEHEWLVKSAAGQWSQVYGLLLKDALLAEKKDFMSGFTALHWAVKSGNLEMVSIIIRESRKSDRGVDINAKSHGGYTPLHIAALHNHLHLINLLLNYGANRNVRDNCGKKAYHYLPKGVPKELKQLLGDPKANHQEVHQVREEFDPYKHLKTPYRLFPSHPMGLKKKNKARGSVTSLCEDGRDEKNEPVLHKQRLFSDVFH